MKLYYFETPNGRKPCAVAKHLNAPVTFERVDLGQGENQQADFLAINPNGKIPVLQDGDVTLWESVAIMVYLAQKMGSDLWPTDPAQQVRALQWINWDTAHFSRHAGRLFWERYIKPAFGLGETNPEEVEDADGFFRRFAGVLDAHLQENTYVLGDTLCVADFAIGSFIPEADKAGLPLDSFSAVTRWHDGLMELPAWREPYPQS